jgi:peptidylprolyl isomerase
LHKFASLPLVLSLSLLCAGAQTSTAPHRTAARTHTAHRAATAPADQGPALPPGVPPAPGKLTTAFALRYIDTKIGEGDVAAPGQFYTVHYTGWLASDGTKFESSVDRGEPITFFQGARRVIPGWDLGFSGMHVGGKRRLFIPYQLAYGEMGRPPVIPPKSDLIFDVELLSVSAAPPQPPAPAPPQPASPPEGNPSAGSGSTPPPPPPSSR